MIEKSGGRSVHSARILVGIVALYVLAYCGPTIPIAFPRYPSGTGTQLKAVLEGKRNLGVVAARPPQSMLNRIGYHEDFSATIEAAVEAQIIKKGFYNVIDLSSRKERLRELAHSQSGLTMEALNLGLEEQVEQMLVVRMTNQPYSQCKVKKVNDLAGGLTTSLMARAGATDEKPEFEKDTAVMFLTIFVQGKITNVETGRSVSHQYSKAYEYFNKPGDLNCPSELAAFDGALQAAAQELASNLSPQVVTINVPLMEDADDLHEEDAEVVHEYLSSGNAWAEARDYEMASQSWRRALSESNGDSVSALWNLAIYSWYEGNYDEAETFFKRALEGGGPGMRDSAKRELFSEFGEQKRLEEGGTR
ncbi:MAG: hypothetical protein KDK27_02095 [Leptospiraceae bacterium]|nr:hypothetical protein [Leptospiraceae bacterium]